MSLTGGVTNEGETNAANVLGTQVFGAFSDSTVATGVSSPLVVGASRRGAGHGSRVSISFRGPVGRGAQPTAAQGDQPLPVGERHRDAHRDVGRRRLEHIRRPGPRFRSSRLRRRYTEAPGMAASQRRRRDAVGGHARRLGRAPRALYRPAPGGFGGTRLRQKLGLHGDTPYLRANL